MAFKGKVVIITGASSGIGAETAVDFSKQGAKVVLVGRNSERLAAVVAKCSKLSALSVVADVSKESDNERIIKTTIDKFGQLDVLVNNAGSAIVGSIETVSLADLDTSLQTNLRSAYHLMMLAVPHLIKTKGNIVNVSSVVGYRSFAGILPYSISKAAMDQLTKCTALELAPKGVRVNSVNPAVIRTNFQKTSMGLDKEAYTAYVDRAKETHPLGRIGTPLEVAKAIAFLANEETASFITGTLLMVDGGKAIMCPR